MLQYLVTSKVRRRLLSLLWAEEQRGSVTELAALAGVAFAGAHVELKRMQRAQLAVTRREGGRDVYAANFDHPHATALREIVSASRTPSLRAEEQPLKGRLVALGAPLRGVEPLAVKQKERMATLFQGVQLARRDPAVARGLPLCFWNLRDELDVRALEAMAVRAEDKHALGFYIELAGELGGDRRLLGLAEHFKDHRVTSLRSFFQGDQSGRGRDFPLAKKWGFQLNMDRDSFKTLFDKLAHR